MNDTLKSKMKCYRGFPHVCEKHPEDCDYKADEEDVKECFKKVREEICCDEANCKLCKKIDKIILKHSGFTEDEE